MANARYMSSSHSVSPQQLMAARNRRHLESAARALQAAISPARQASLEHYTDRTDNGQAVQARHTAEALRQVLLEKQLVVAHALEQIAAGSYGRCEDCSRPIERDRLRVLPEATRCVDCQRRRSS
ncbi:MAG TPA: TraR/DksA C4-type zinc finger protein [Candidatus Dormibacteraeota bacterium]|nr:TraR/DksA C4-type zinc finger protein [Candidatus Dormibacteraeota bacterium]